MEVTSRTTPGRISSELLRLGWSVRITTHTTISGTGYNIFRRGHNFKAEMRALMPWLRRARHFVLIPDAALAAGLAVTIEPLDTVLEEEFILTVGRFLVEA